MMVELIGDGDVQTTTVSTGAEALAALDRQKFDCMVLDLDLPDMTGFELIARIKQSARVPAPIVVYSSKDFTADEETQLRALSETVIVKDVRSPERLLDETALFLHRSEAKLPEEKRKLLEKIHRSSPVIAGKKVLIVDDDMRNIFALTSALERHQMQILQCRERPGSHRAAARDARRRRRADGHHDARDGRLRSDPQAARRPTVRGAADHRRDGQGHEGRSRSVHRSWRLRLHQQAHRHGRPGLAAPRVVEPPLGARAMTSYAAGFSARARSTRSMSSGMDSGLTR